MAQTDEEKIRQEMDEVMHGGSGKAQGQAGPAAFQQNDASKIHNVIGVISGKGGVGKSLVCGMLAVELARQGKRVGILDADVTGPSIPKMLGLGGVRAMAQNNLILPAITEGGIEVMSANLVLEHETDPVIWRGPVISGVIKQFWEECAWGELDVLLVDMPPGTGDVPLTVFQSLPVEGVVVVSSPQDLVQMVVGKAFNMAKLMNVPVLGLVENMAYFTCPNCGEKIWPYGPSRLEETAKAYDIDALDELPIDPKLAAACDAGTLERELPQDALPKAAAAVKAVCGLSDAKRAAGLE
ncbi:MAG: P-loop NTPase [Tractidigestivibacter sp.]|jgi:ATP-binding protein involved in chromosome partitioning|uniref:P-loop NTPase n=1 Tax=Tractidigestivibacter sp. TaxID=2847320 RepID=UPI003D9483D1